MNNLTAANERRLQNCLSKLYSYPEGVMTQQEHIESKALTGKKSMLRTREMRKRECCYKKLATPIREYLLQFIDDDGRECWILVPKLIYDYYDSLPITK